MSDTALLIIDMQTGNFSGQHPIFKGYDLLTKVKNLVNKACAAHKLNVYVQNYCACGDPDEYGTAGWEIHSTISPSEEDVIIQKWTPDAFHKTNLHRELESRTIEALFIAGLQTEYCRDTTCRRAFGLGYEVTLIEDAHSTWDSPLLSAQQIIEHHNQILGGCFTILKKEREIKF